jgi:oxygen-independent coproporphyrinogen-3 oxidase
MESLGIYIHIPFCKRKCDYCDFYSICDLSDKLMDRYLKALISQIDEYFQYGKPSVDTVYLGGGTPSVFGGKRIEKLLKELSARVQLARNAEITVEVNPESVDEKLLKRLKAAGVNRISMGVQSADDNELKALGRLHDWKGAVSAYELTRRYFDNISLDLIYGLENQTLDGWMDSLRKVMALSPDHISCYCLKVEEGTPLALRGCVQPDDDVQADMYLRAVETLEAGGYRQYEISNFARNGRVSRHNSKYWDLSPYLGLGSAAHSR